MPVCLGNDLLVSANPENPWPRLDAGCFLKDQTINDSWHSSLARLVAPASQVPRFSGLAQEKLVPDIPGEPGLLHC